MDVPPALGRANARRLTAASQNDIQPWLVQGPSFFECAFEGAACLRLQNLMHASSWLHRLRCEHPEPLSPPATGRQSDLRPGHPLDHHQSRRQTRFHEPWQQHHLRQPRSAHRSLAIVQIASTRDRQRVAIPQTRTLRCYRIRWLHLNPSLIVFHRRLDR